MPQISVVMPAYNAEKTIRQTIESVLNQTYHEFELIVINDGSTDSTLEVVASVEDKRIEVFSYPNSGLSAARNRGIAHACGEFIAFMDADDLWKANKLEAQLEALQANPEAALAYCWTDWIDTFGQPLNKGVYAKAEGDVFQRLLLNNFIANGSNPLVRKEAFEKVGLFAEELDCAEDWEMWLRLAQHYHFVVVREALVLHRRSHSSLSANLLALEATSRQVIERAYQRAPESLQHLKTQTLARLYKNLTVRTVAILPESEKYVAGRQRGLTAARFLCYTVRYNPSYLWQKNFVFPALRRIASMILRPSK